MNMFISLSDIVTAAVVVIMLLVIAVLFMWSQITEWRKRRARKLLADDIARYERKVKTLEHYGDVIHYMQDKEAVLCPTLLKGIIEMLPDPNRLSEVGTTILKGHPVKMYIAGRGNVTFSLDFIADKDDAPTGEKGLTVKISPTGQVVRFTLKQQNIRRRFQGVDVEVNGYFWDLRFSGIQLISDEGFGRIIDFVLASRIVGEDLGLSGARPRHLMGSF